MKTVEIPPEALKTALTGAVGGVGFVVVARLVLTVPASVCLCVVLVVAAAAAVYAAGFRVGEAERDDE